MSIAKNLITNLQNKENVTRSEIQEISKIASDEHDVLFLWHTTSTGKSGSVIKICSDVTKKVLMSHNQSIHQKNFETEAKERNYDISHFTHTLWNSYHKYYDTEWDYIVIDEVDYAISNHLAFLKKVKYKKLILLTGTITTTQLKLLKKELNPFIFKITMSDIIRFGIIKEPIIYLKLIELDNKVQNIEYYKNFKITELKASEKYDEDILNLQNKLKEELELLTEKLIFDKTKELLELEYKDSNLKSKLKDLTNRYHIIVKSIKAKYKELDFVEDIPDIYLSENIENKLHNFNAFEIANSKIYNMDNWTFKNQILLGGKRKKFYETVKMREFEKGNYFNRLKDKRCIFFLPSVEDCESLGNSITHKSTKTNQLTIDKFNDKEINYLTTKRIINRAVSVEDVQFGCILTFDFSTSSTKQGFGRVCRSYGVPQIVMFIIKNTKEEKIFNEHFKNYGGKIKFI